MALSHSPSIVTDGLIFCLDAANTKSYPGSGVTWNDLSSQTNVLTLTNGPVYNTTTSPNILFDGVDDYAVDNGNNALKEITNGGNFTIDCFIKRNFTASLNVVICANRDTGISVTAGFILAMGTSIGDIRIGYGSATSQNLLTTAANIPLDTWVHVVASCQYLAPSTLIRTVYINRQLVHGPISGVFGGTISASTNSFFIGIRPNLTQPVAMNLGSLKVYNKILNASEVTQNFNALRGRFGI